MTASAGPARAAIASAALAGAALLVTACSGPASSTQTGRHSSGGAPAASASPTASAQAAGGSAASGSGSGASQPRTSQSGMPPCATSGLRGAMPAIGSAAAGHVYYPLELTNASTRSCTLQGYPGVSFVTSAGGSQIGAAASRAAAGQQPYGGPQTITLPAGQTAHAVLQLALTGYLGTSQCGSTVSAHWLRVYPPGQTAPLYVSFNSQACSSPTLVTLTVGPVLPVGTAAP